MFEDDNIGFRNDIYKNSEILMPKGVKRESVKTKLIEAKKSMTILEATASYLAKKARFMPHNGKGKRKGKSLSAPAKLNKP